MKRASPPGVGGVRTTLRSRASKRKAIDPAACLEHGRLFLDRPVPGEGPLVERQPLRAVAGAALAPRVAEVRLRGSEGVPVGGGLDAGRLDPNWFAVGAQQLPNRRLGLAVGALAEMLVAKAPIAVDQVERRPVVVVERAPDRVLVVEHDRVLDPHLLHRPAHPLELALEGELGGVRADDHQPAVAVGAHPGPDVGKGADPVDAGVGAELDGHDLPGQSGGRQRLRVEPLGRAVELESALPIVSLPVSNALMTARRRA